MIRNEVGSAGKFSRLPRLEAFKACREICRKVIMVSKQITSFTDTCVLYFSKADGSWIAHSLHTDQVGTGENILDALMDIMCGLNDLWALTRKNQSIGLFREAPTKIQKLAQKAEPLPEEISQIALRKIHGDWPKGLRFNVEAIKKRLMRATISEPLNI